MITDAVIRQKRHLIRVAGRHTSSSGTCMLKLAFLLIGPAAFRARWYGISLAGGLLVVLAVMLATGLSPMVTWASYVALGGGFIAAGCAMLPAVVSLPGERRWRGLVRPAASIAAGALVLSAVFLGGSAMALAFALAFILDGLVRAGMALIVRFAGWVVSCLCGVAELGLAVMLLSGWPLSPGWNLPFCVGLFVGLSGWLLIRLGLMLRGLEDEAAILLLPVFGARGWYDHAPVLIGDNPPSRPDDPPILIRVWTPTGQARSRRPVIDRYLAATDADGAFSTGHATLELTPDIYISHCPATDFDPAGRSLVDVLHGGVGNDVPGIFQRSYDDEVQDWRPADVSVAIRRYSPRRLRAFWAGYKQDATYNITNRNCSVVVAAALEAALEGVFAGPYPWARLLWLLIDPDMWMAAMIRSRATSMTWTPGLVLDYARTLSRLVDHRDRSWGRRFQGFLARMDDNTPDMGANAG